MNKSIARHQKGVALIIVLLIVAIVSVLATEMGTRLQLQIKRASNIKENNQAYWYAMGAEQFAQKSLSELYKSSSAVIHLEQPWNQEFTFPIEGGIQAQLVDLQSCFNLNALGIANSGTGANTELAQRLNAFSQVMETIEPQIPSYEIDTVRESLADWLDTDSQSRSLGAEDSEYESLPFPYVAANDLMTHKSEMRLIKWR
ncbi:type II secretion system minor pseudopilin GspK [Paraglaciecola aquimarina]|uniref:Type II secretion system minor pseudopilin GspK n=1 Tax=Paraglaciecola aquimarina TaxID=1235557 RepID=A0ABU3STA9_9ALTE|nr:type II secretion system minor pseudopilin GspK [Paraglaciecola aquimarina]MDU0353229.1 type II secretion system minor pseudopilin GspK [Paraglaciecola aquimarina]